MSDEEMASRFLQWTGFLAIVAAALSLSLWLGLVVGEAAMNGVFDNLVR